MVDRPKPWCHRFAKARANGLLSFRVARFVWFARLGPLPSGLAAAAYVQAALMVIGVLIGASSGAGLCCALTFPPGAARQTSVVGFGPRACHHIGVGRCRHSLIPKDCSTSSWALPPGKRAGETRLPRDHDWVIGQSLF